jgi:hypothetical protein
LLGISVGHQSFESKVDIRNIKKLFIVKYITINLLNYSSLSSFFCPNKPEAISFSSLGLKFESIIALEIAVLSFF